MAVVVVRTSQVEGMLAPPEGRDLAVERPVSEKSALQEDLGAAVVTAALLVSAVAETPALADLHRGMAWQKSI